MADLTKPVTSDDHIEGDLKAAVLLVEYGDYECPHCGHAHPIVKRLQKHFGKKLGFVFRNFPLKQIHPNAEPAAESAEFAGAGGEFWKMHDQIFENQDRLSVELLLELADAIGLSSAELGKALEGHSFARRVRDDFLGGVRSG